MSQKGFASLTAAERREVASKGGKAAHRLGRAHEFTSEEARENGRRGGRALFERRGVSHMSAIGRRGGKKRGKAEKLGEGGAA